MKRIIYHLWVVLFLFACNETEPLDYSQLSVNFQKSKVDVGENTDVLEIPVVLSGYRDDQPLAVEVDITTTDGEAIAGTDYELIDRKLTFNSCGTSLLKVKIIDNEEITQQMKTFTINIKANNNVQSQQSAVKVYIISEDVQKFTLAGQYTFTAENFIDGTKYSSAAGGVQIVQDQVDENKYYLRTLNLINGAQILPLTMGDDLYFTVDANGNMTMPMQQKIGDYGKGEGFIMNLKDDGNANIDPLKIERSGQKLYFTNGSLVGLSVGENDATSIYYALKNLILEKTN